MKNDTQKYLDNQNSSPILIVDKSGIYGRALATLLFEKSKLVFVSPLNIDGHTVDSEFLHIPFNLSIPTIPDLTYSHLIVFFNGESSMLDSIPSFIKKAEKDNSKLIIAVPIHILSDFLIKKLSLLSRIICVVFLGDIFGKNIPLTHDILMHNYLIDALTDQKIIISGDGLEKTYPVFVDDAMLAIISASLKSQRKGMYFAFPKHAVTGLALAHEFQKINPLIKVDFSKNKKLRQVVIPLPSNGEYLLHDNYNLRERLKQSKLLEEKSIKILKKPRKKKYLFNYLSSLFSLILFLLLPLIISIISATSGISSLKYSKDLLIKGNLNESKKYANISSIALTITQGSLDFVIAESEVFGFKKDILLWSDRLSSLREISYAMKSFVESVILVKDIASGKSSAPKEDIYRAVNDIREVISVYKKVQVEQADFIKENNLIIQLDKIDPLVNFFTVTADVLPDILGVNGEKKYLIIFQNNMEIRPSGGFIGSYALAKINKGKMISFDIHDVYDADGQLKGHVEPPFAVRRHIPSAHLYLRDSNFDPDFAKSASMSALLFREETDTDVDGVIGIDVTFVKLLIRALVSVEVLDYNEIVTDENFYIITQGHAEKNSFPGSIQKKEFLHSLFEAMMEKINSKKDINYAAIINSFSEGLSKKHLLFAFSDISIQNLFSINNYSSSLKDLRTETGGTINDFLVINDANIGVNKANYFIKRKIEQHVVIDDNGKTTTRAVVRFINESKDWPGGDYKNYIRFVIPTGSKIISIFIDGIEQQITPAIIKPSVYEAKNFIAPRGLEVDSKTFENKDYIGFLVNIPASKNGVVALTYQHPKILVKDIPSIIYDTKIIKQPGTEDDPFIFTIKFPDAYTITTSSSPLNINGSGLEFSANLLNDFLLRILLSHK